jgi:hypothetical protein
MRTLAVVETRRIGFGGSGRCAAQTVQARASRTSFASLEMPVMVGLQIERDDAQRSDWMVQYRKHCCRPLSG